MEKRFEELDSLRGLAALSVLFGHMLLIFNSSYVTTLLFEYGPLRFTVAGSEAVTLFFVLSGFVLSLPFYTKRRFSYGKYTIKRLCRIYIPYISAIIITLVLRELFFTNKIIGLSQWFNVNWSQPFTLFTFKEHLLLISTFTSNLNNVVWSLVHEMRISLVFPLIMFILIRLNIKKSIMFCISMSIISVVYAIVFEAQFLGTELYATLHYSSIFVVGALLSKYHTVLKQHLLQLNMPKKCLLFFTGVILFLYAHPSFILNIIQPGFDPFLRAVIDTWFTSIGASIIIMFAISGNFFSEILNKKLVNYIGKISYSLYLIHLPVLFSSFHLLYNVLPTWVVCVVAFAASLMLASLMYHLIEKQSIKFGKYLTKQWIDKTKQVEEVSA
ncbi:acyltransferase family protein [Mesobacillus foraminis]|uniref:Peptidoglycan/LPS O-acetylase OafA/YrhL n=1 Tax=Mesobacillus foraminis TaxID=279826 RepID=A0A4R2B813_9BACI|nr:acyltransferase [Mesobacillus foraminis]TCN22212.1 peptidoglycan/LPS O-acetylase OafA/YrhL [Mesobacillus foraminis]